MSNAFKNYFISLFVFTALLISEQLVYEYTIHTGANLVSFPLITDNYDIDYFFSDSNINLITGSSLESHIISLITEGEMTFINNDQWLGSLDEIDTKKGYWLISDQELTFLLTGENLTDNIYYMHPGGNLISYPFNQNQSYYEAIPIITDNILAILGENEALYNNNGVLIGSLTTFKPGKGYWFIVNDYTPFQYSSPSLSSHNNHPDEPIRDNEILEFNQSTLQSVFFIENIYLSGSTNESPIELKAICNDNIVGQGNWNGEFSDLIAMGDDSFPYTANYCTENEEVIIENNQNSLYVITGNNAWSSNNFEILSLSDCDYGDLNFSYNLNISDIILLIEHITSISILSTDHQIILADINQDNNINVTDIIIIVDQILNN
tara:strand:+ start:64 stop:1200 length:1137 start_codon:yes stop_codon:yes gene_type:complete